MRVERDAMRKAIVARLHAILLQAFLVPSRRLVSAAMAVVIDLVLVLDVSDLAPVPMFDLTEEDEGVKADSAVILH